MPAGTVCAIIKVAHMQIFRAISQYLTHCTTLLFSHWDYNGENVKNLKIAQKYILVTQTHPKAWFDLKMATLGGGGGGGLFSGFFFGHWKCYFCQFRAFWGIRNGISGAWKKNQENRPPQMCFSLCQALPNLQVPFKWSNRFIFPSKSRRWAQRKDDLEAHQENQIQGWPFFLHWCYKKYIFDALNIHHQILHESFLL